ncbi:PHP-associated domain-containing protein [Dactylosporangium sp. CA-233914]|uniref:PHP-associated domain-containing protein n=1 Tax=Dactylosporangium sp. CA-233914 TaxID=3239934 RepID=UPI003D90A6E9
MWNGRWAGDLPWNADNEAALTRWRERLAAGRWMPAVGSSDAHLAGQIGVPHTVVFAEALTVEAVLAGLRGGRSWIAGGAGIEVDVVVEAGGKVAGAGQRLVTGGAPVCVRVRVRGVAEPDVRVHGGALTWVEVRHPGGAVAALTNPVFVVD